MRNNGMPEISNLKDNSYDITVDGEKYHITIRKGQEVVRGYFRNHNPNDVNMVTYCTFYLDAASDSRSFSIYSHFRDLSFGEGPEHRLSFYVDYPSGGKAIMEPKDFYEKAFAIPFKVKSPVVLDNAGEVPKSLWVKFLRENITLESMVKDYWQADNKKTLSPLELYEQRNYQKERQ